MISFNVSVPDNKSSFFKEFLEMIGAKYTENTTVDFELSEEQKKHLLKQNKVSFDQCIDAEKSYVELKEKYGL